MFRILAKWRDPASGNDLIPTMSAGSGSNRQHDKDLQPDYSDGQVFHDIKVIMCLLTFFRIMPRMLPCI